MNDSYIEGNIVQDSGNRVASLRQCFRMCRMIPTCRGINWRDQPQEYCTAFSDIIYRESRSGWRSYSMSDADQYPAFIN